VFRALAYAPRKSGWLWAYRTIPGFRATSEWAYRVVARQRPVFSRVTDWVWGAHVTPPGEEVTCWIYLRLLGIVCAVAFASLWIQEAGLIGSHGILPAAETMRALRTSAPAGTGSRRLLPG